MAVFTNFATLSYKGGTRNSNTVTGEIIETVTVEKTTVSTAYTAGDTLSYAVSLVNSGPADVTGLTVSDDLGAYELDGAALYPLAYVKGTAHLIVNGTLQPAPTVTAGPPLVFTDIDIPAGGSAVLVYEADVTGYAPLSPDSVITNTVTVTGGGVSVPLSASAAVGTMDQLDLRISKALSPSDYATLGITYGQGADKISISTDSKGFVHADVMAGIVRPYVGLGFGRAIKPGSRVRVSFDMGVLVTGGVRLQSYSYLRNEKGDPAVITSKQLITDEGQVDDGWVDKICGIPVLPMMKLNVFVRLF